MNDTFEICEASMDDAQEILDLQKRAYATEAALYNDYTIPPLKQSSDSIKSDFNQWVFLKVVDQDEIIGSVRAFRDEDTCYIGRLIVDKDYQNMGIGRNLMQKVEEIFNDVKRFELFTGCKSEKNLYLYEKLGYKVFKTMKVDKMLTLVYLEKLV